MGERIDARVTLERSMFCEKSSTGWLEESDDRRFWLTSITWGLWTFGKFKIIWKMRVLRSNTGHTWLKQQKGCRDQISQEQAWYCRGTWLVQHTKKPSLLERVSISTIKLRTNYKVRQVEVEGPLYHLHFIPFELQGIMVTVWYHSSLFWEDFNSPYGVPKSLMGREQLEFQRTGGGLDAEYSGLDWSTIQILAD